MSGHHSPDEAKLAYRAMASLAIVALVAAGATVAVRAAYGAFSDDFTVRARFARAGQGLRSGSDVKYRGVNVGEVRSLELEDRQVDVAIDLRKDVEIPADTTATVRPKTLFGEKYVELAVRPKGGPYLKDGDRLKAGGTGLEVEELVDTTDDLLRQVDEEQLATLMDELVQASRGEGDRVARLIDRSVAATAVMDDTLEAQLRAIDSFARFTREYRDIGPSLNSINANLNELLPTFNAAREDYERLLVTLKPFADHLAEFIDVNEADIGALLADGNNIVRVLTARKANISETIRGLDTYTATLADAIAPGTLPDGSRYGNLKLFIDLSQIQDLLCMVLAPARPAPTCRRCARRSPPASRSWRARVTAAGVRRPPHRRSRRAHPRTRSRPTSRATRSPTSRRPWRRRTWPATAAASAIC
ncbi:MCE family protein [Aquihabitans daechungensis]|uniref:MCE family protein n=1 Tax=Aquihabitans daechungensis TaxID=1052257 RepID=UPI003BA33CFD